MHCDAVELGMTVCTYTRLGTTDGMLIHERHLQARGTTQLGVVLNWVPGHGGDVWFVRHVKTGDVAAYCFNEFDLPRYKRVSRSGGRNRRARVKPVLIPINPPKRPISKQKKTYAEWQRTKSYKKATSRFVRRRALKLKRTGRKALELKRAA
jgi:hypothetical protein